MQCYINYHHPTTLPQPCEPGPAQIQVIHLKTNRHLDQTSQNIEFACRLLTVGADEGLTEEQTIPLPASMHLTDSTISGLISIYPNIELAIFKIVSFWREQFSLDVTTMLMKLISRFWTNVQARRQSIGPLTR